MTPELVESNLFAETLKSIMGVVLNVNKCVVKILLSAKVHVVNQHVIASMVSFVIVKVNVFTKMIALFVKKMNSLKMEYANVKLVLP